MSDDEPAVTGRELYDSAVRVVEHCVAVPNAGRDLTPFEEDGLAVAVAWLNDHPEDDGERLTDDWLKAAGSDTESPACVSGHDFKMPDGSLLFLWGYEGGGYSVTLTAHPELDRHADDVSGEIELADIGTRGEFRRLALALGLTLKETP